MEENNTIQFPKMEENDFDLSEIIENSEYKELFSQLGEQELQEISALLSLPDEQFQLLSEAILQELERSFSSSQDLSMLRAELIANGIEIEELIEVYNSILEALDGMVKEEGLTQVKVDFLKRIIGMLITLYSAAASETNEMVSIPIELVDGAVIPEYAKPGDAGMDLCALDDYDIAPGQTVLIRTGIKVAIPYGYALLIQPRSGFSVKTKLRIPNTPGLIDSGYRDEIKIAMENIESSIQALGEPTDLEGFVNGTAFGKTYHIDKGQRVAQMRLVKVPTIVWNEVSNIQEIAGDRKGGFGSTGEF